MSSAAWGAVGTLLGGLITALGSWLVGVAQQRASTAARSADAALTARLERKAAYLGLLGVCRRLRFLARVGPAQPDARELDQLRADLSALTYEIDLVAPPAIAQRAQELAEATRAYLRLGLASASAATPQTTEAAQVVQDARVRVRHLVDVFITDARGDLTDLHTVQGT